MEEELESLRQKSAQTEDVYADMESDVGGGGFLGNLSASQRLILALLLLVDVIAVGVGVLLVTGAISF